MNVKVISEVTKITWSPISTLPTVRSGFFIEVDSMKVTEYI
jgi:hypothetical protein